MKGGSVWETIRLVLAQPRSFPISCIYFLGPAREDLNVGAKSGDVKKGGNVRFSLTADLMF